MISEKQLYRSLTSCSTAAYP